MNAYWLKLATDIFSDRKIVLLRKMPAGDTLFVFWTWMLCEGMKSKELGIIQMTEGDDPIEEISSLTSIEINTVRLGVAFFLKHKMIAMDGTRIDLLNFRQHQSLDRIEHQRERNRLKQERFREKYRVSNRLLTDIRGEERRGDEMRKDKDSTPIQNQAQMDLPDASPNKPHRSHSDYLPTVDTKHEPKPKNTAKSDFDLWNELAPPECPRVQVLNQMRSKKLSLRKKEGMVMADVIEKIRDSQFLRGSTGWIATFDWIIENPGNWVKVIEGNYEKSGKAKASSPVDQVNKFLNKLAKNEGGTHGA